MAPKRTESPTDDMTKRVQDLPTELYTMIYDFTFTSGPSNVRVDKFYRRPNTLQVSCATRAQSAEAYYRETTFRFENPLLMGMWLLVMEEKPVVFIRRSIKAIQCHPYSDELVKNWVVNFSPDMIMDLSHMMAQTDRGRSLWRPSLYGNGNT